MLTRNVSCRGVWRSVALLSPPRVPIRKLQSSFSTTTVDTCAEDTVIEEINAANEKGRGLWRISNTRDKGWGIFAVHNIPKNTNVFRASMLKQDPTRNSHSVQTSWDSHVYMDLPARFINHSCSANVGIKDNSLGAFDFYTLRDLKHGEELTWDYGASEFDSIAFDTCLCGSSICRGADIGFKQAHAQIRQQYGKFYASYLHNWQP